MAGTNRNISVRAVGDFTNLSQGLQRAQTEIQSFGDRAKAKFKEIAAASLEIFVAFEAFKEIGEVFGELANRAAELDGGMSSLNRTLGQSAIGYQDWANSTAKSFGISQMSAVEYGKSIAMLLGDVYHNQAQLAQATEQFMQGGAVIAAKTGKSQQEVYEDLNSALMGHAAAVKSLDINILNNALVHSEAYKQISNGAPWAKLTVAQQQYIRVTELNRQIQQKFGDTIGNGMDARLMLFKMSLDNIKTSLAQAFMPILYQVLPILSTFMSWISTAISYVAEFFQTLFGYKGIQAGAAGSINQQAKAVNDLGNAYSTAGTKATKASKALSGGSGSTKKSKSSGSSKGTTASFDQVHTLDTSSSASGGGSSTGGGGGGTASIPSTDIPTPTIPTPDATKTQGVLGKVSDAVKQFAEKFKDWLKPIKPYWDDLVSSCQELWKAIVNLYNSPAFQGFLKFLAAAIQMTIIVILEEISNAIKVLADVINLVTDIINGNWKQAWNDTLKLLNDLVGLITGIKASEWGKIFENAWGDYTTWVYNHITKPLTDFINSAVNWGKNMWSGFTTGWGNVQSWFKSTVTDKINSAFNGLSSLGSHIWDWITSGYGSVQKWFSDHISNPIDSAFNSLTSFGSKIWSGLTRGYGSVSSWFSSHISSPIRSAFDSVTSFGSRIWHGLTSGFGSVKSWFTNYVVNPIRSAFSSITSGLGNALTSGFKSIFDKAADFLNTFINAFNSGKSHFPFGLGNIIPNIPKIPHLANGGITNGPMLAMIGDNPGGQEVVSPLDKLAGMITSSMIQVMQMNKSNNTNPGDVILNLDGRTFARVIKPWMDLENKRVGTNVRLQSI